MNTSLWRAARVVAISGAISGTMSGCSSGGEGGICGVAFNPRVLALQCETPEIPQPQFGTPASGTVSGVVTEWSVGYSGCLAGAIYLVDAGVSDQDVRILTIATSAGATQSFGLVVQGLSPPIALGDAVDVRYSIDRGGFSPGNMFFEVKKAGSLLLYLAQSGVPGDLMLPDGMSAALGPRLCSLRDDCGPYARYRLAFDAGGARASLAPAKLERVGDVAVLVGESVQQTAAGQCADWFVSQTTVGLTP